MYCTQNVQDHVIHFYHLHALDWVDVVSALKADPKETSRIAQSISHWPKSSPQYFADLQKRLTSFVQQRPARHLRQRLLGPSGLQAAARDQPDRGGPLPRGPGMAEGDHQGPHDLRRQEPASRTTSSAECPARSTSTRRMPSTPSAWRWSASCSRTPRISSSRSTIPTSWPSRRTTSTGPASAAAWRTTSATATSRRTASATSRATSSSGARSSGGT